MRFGNAEELAEYREALNRLLEDDGFNERFEADEDKLNHQGEIKRIDKLTLAHSIVSSRTMELIAEREPRGSRITLRLHFLNTNRMFLIDEKECWGPLCRAYALAAVYDTVKAVLTDKIVTVAYPKGGSGYVQGIELYCPIGELDLVALRPRGKEIKFAAEDSHLFECWSGGMTNAQCEYIAGLLVTRHPRHRLEQKRIRDERRLSQKGEHICWRGRMKKSWAVLFPFLLYFIVLLLFTPFCCFGFFGGWRCFLIVEGSMATLALLAVPLSMVSFLRARYYITNLRAVKAGGEKPESAWFHTLSGTKENSSDLCFQFKPNRTGLQKMENPTDLETALTHIRDGIAAYEGTAVHFMQRYESFDEQGKFARLFEVVEDVLSVFAYAHIEYATPCMTPGTEIAEITGFALNNPSKDALYAFVLETYARFYGRAGMFESQAADWAAGQILKEAAHKPAQSSAEISPV